MHTILTQVVPAVALFALPLFFTGQARATPLGSYKVVEEETPSSKYTNEKHITIPHDQKRDLAAAVVERRNALVHSQGKRQSQREINEHSDAPILVTVDRRDPSKVESKSNVQLRPTKRWNNGPTCCGNPCWTPCNNNQNNNNGWNRGGGWGGWKW